MSILITMVSRIAMIFVQTNTMVQLSPCYRSVANTVSVATSARSFLAAHSATLRSAQLLSRNVLA